MKYKLFSQDKDELIKEFNSFDADGIKGAIIQWLNENKNDCVEYWIDDNVKSFYKNNKGIPSRLIPIGSREVYRSLIKMT